jgi:hypothetical protein
MESTTTSATNGAQTVSTTNLSRQGRGRLKGEPRNFLTNPQRCRLTLKVAERLQEFQKNGLTLQQASELLTVDLGFKVTIQNLETILDGLGTQLNPPRKPYTKKRNAGSRPEQAARLRNHRAIIQSVQALGLVARTLCTQLGQAELIQALAPLDTQAFQDALEFYDRWAKVNPEAAQPAPRENDQ